jgi:hypothetical protein
VTRHALFICPVAAWLAVVACGNNSPKQNADAVPIAITVRDDVALPGLYSSDAVIVERHGAEALAIARPGAAVDQTGLIGRNRAYGKMVSPRLQLGAGAALRVGLHGDRQVAINGFKAIEAGSNAIAADGEVMSTVPPDAAPGARLSIADKASGAAFFLADACPAMLALRTSGDPAVIVSDDKREAVEKALGRAIRWLAHYTADLERVDGKAPNRLLYDALAFQSCGKLEDDGDVTALSSRFVGTALGQYRADGVFVEKGGSDTTYQAVSVRLALDLLLAGYSAEDASQLNRAWQSGAIWLGNRIMADGRIDSTRNTRTCQGGESFLGTEKKVWPAGVYGALIYAAELTDNEGLKSAATRLSAWAQANPKADPCFPSSP